MAMGFPKGFVWGAAAASYQVEGAAREDGKGPSVWDMMCRWSGKVADGNTGDVACDHYHRCREDAALMRNLGIHAYRLSVSWPRVMPSGTGKVNAKGIAFYDRFVDALLANNVEPLQRHFQKSLGEIGDLKGIWEALEKSRKLAIPEPESLLVLTASKAEIEKEMAKSKGSRDRFASYSWSMGRYYGRGRTTTPGEMLASHEVVNGILPLMSYGAR